MIENHNKNDPINNNIPTDMKQHTLEILQGIENLAIQHPNVLQILCYIAIPNLMQDKLIQIVKEILNLKNIIFSANTNQLNQILQSNNPSSPIHIKLFLGLRELGIILSFITPLQILHLTNNIIPPGNLDYQTQFIIKLKEIFQLWGIEGLKERHKTISQTPLNQETHQLLKLEPQIPWDLLHLLLELFKLPYQHLEKLRDSLNQFQKPQIEKFIYLITKFKSVYLIEIKRLIGIPLPNYNNNQVINDNNTNNNNNNNNNQQQNNQNQQNIPFKLRMVVQPANKTVYQRIIKPFPSLILEGGPTDRSNLFVEASLVRFDSEEELPCFDGNKKLRISNGQFATFKKLKITSTSQQVGTKFRIKFQLKKYDGENFTPITNAKIITEGIEVYSHTGYLTDKKSKAAPPPVIHDIIPNCTQVGVQSKIVIIGSNFVKTPNLKVKFGNVEVIPTFHETGTLIVSTPIINSPAAISLSVSNDGINWCTPSKFYFKN